LDEGDDAVADWTPDSKAMILALNRDGHYGIYKQLLTEDSPEPIVTMATHGFRDARVTPDGNWVIAMPYPNPGGPAAHEQLVRMPIAGGSPTLMFTVNPSSLSFCARPPSNLCAIAEASDDHKQVVVTAYDPIKGRGAELARFDIGAGDRWFCDLSPDGTHLAATPSAEGPVQIFPLGGQAKRTLPVKGLNNILALNWAADGKGLFVTNRINDGTVLLHVDLRGNVKRLWKSGGGPENPGRPSPDGRHLAIQTWTSTSNIWMMENF
jgi:Tol biopolymer transport system component